MTKRNALEETVHRFVETADSLPKEEIIIYLKKVPPSQWENEEKKVEEVGKVSGYVTPLVVFGDSNNSRVHHGRMDAFVWRAKYELYGLDIKMVGGDKHSCYAAFKSMEPEDQELYEAVNQKVKASRMGLITREIKRLEKERARIARV